uniref:mRNA-capping enzyme n=1 Tax=Bursaphelenchus xylophilus TaxID=6326 RepID=A0A1I7RSI2_BURXY
MVQEIRGFLPTKTPLDKKYDHLIDIAQFFHPDDILEKGPELCGKPDNKIGLWINLTKTKRYYNPAEVEDKGIKYIWLPLTGHGQSPTPEETERFINIVKKFRDTNEDDLIVIHCTHGFNRTGFLICAYLVDECGDDIAIAVQEFAKARPDGIYKNDYLRDLADRYGGGDELIGPGRPLWEDESKMVEEKSASGQLNCANGKGKGKKQFMDGQVPSVTYVEDPELRMQIIKTVRELCHWKRKEFPGSQPVSLEHSPQLNNLQFLAQARYMVSWKADGVRYLVYIKDDHEVYALDRDENVFLISDMGFVNYKTNAPLKNCLVDAEMVIDKVNEGLVQRIFPRLLVYDLIYYEEKDIGQLRFKDRFQMIEEYLIKPKKKAFETGVLNRADESIGIRRKDFFFVFYTYKLLEPKFQSGMSHEVDGLIFQPYDEPYVPGRFDKLLKWKPPHQQTIDFRLQIRRNPVGANNLGETQAVLLVQDRGNLVEFARTRPLKKLVQYDNKIIECNFVRDSATPHGEWRIERERTDKSFPNAFTTASSVWNCILYPVTKEKLLNFIAQNCRDHQQPQNGKPPP